MNKPTARGLPSDPALFDAERARRYRRARAEVEHLSGRRRADAFEPRPGASVLLLCFLIGALSGATSVALVLLFALGGLSLAQTMISV